MPAYQVVVEWSGYSRGKSVYIVYAENEAEASENYYDAERIAHGTTRDDTEDEVDSVTLIKEEK